MKRVFVITLCSMLLLPAAVVPVSAGEVIDGVVATVNRQPVLRSDWDEAVTFEAFMRQKPINQVTEEDRALALQRLIDRQLLKAQMVDVEYMQPSDKALREDLAKLRAQVPNANDDAGWRNVLSSYGLNEDVVKQHLRKEVQVLNFVEVRLRPNVHVQPEEVEAYYKNQLLPDLQREGLKPTPLEEVEPRIRELLTQQRIDELLDAWLHNLRQQAEIHTTIPLPAANAPAQSEGASGAD
jgi:hypothetical protein